MPKKKPMLYQLPVPIFLVIGKMSRANRRRVREMQKALLKDSRVDLDSMKLEVPCFRLRFTPEENQALLDARKPKEVLP